MVVAVLPQRVKNLAPSDAGRHACSLRVEVNGDSNSPDGGSVYHRGLLPNRQLLLARLRRAFLQDSPTPGGSLRFAHRGLISFTPPACKPAARKGCADISDPPHRRTLKACEEIPVERPGNNR